MFRLQVQGSGFEVQGSALPVVEPALLKAWCSMQVQHNEVVFQVYGLR